MAKSHHLLTVLGFLIFSGWATHYIAVPPSRPGLACTNERIATSGWTHKDRVIAEMAAIRRWKAKAGPMGAAYSEWHHAQRRQMRCLQVGGPGGHYRCRVSATPCRLADQSEGI